MLVDTLRRVKNGFKVRVQRGRRDPEGFRDRTTFGCCRDRRPRLQRITDHANGRDGPPGRPSFSVRPAVAPYQIHRGVGRTCGVGRSLGVALGITVGVGLGVGVSVGLGVGVSGGVAVGVALGVGVGVGPA
jgi:hypothetical protein